MLQKILIAIGNSPDAAAIFAAGLTLAEKFGAELLILHVLNPIALNGFDTIGSPFMGGLLPIVNNLAIEQYLKEWKEYEKAGIERLQSYAQQAQERQINTEILQHVGDSGSMICAAAKTWSADAIVMGRNQKSTLSEIFLGSTSNYVLHHAPCSVIVIR